MLLELDHVVSGYGQMQIIRGFTTTIPTARITAIIGPNGAGKSTLLKTIYSFIRPTAGRVLLDGRDLTRCEPHELIKQGMLYIQQGRSIFPELTIDENLSMNAFSLHGRGPVHEAFERAYDAFPLLKRRRHQRAGSLSGGERRFLELARIVMLRPKVVLLDEPSIGVAPKAIADIYETISRLHRSGIGFLIVEQNVRLALNVADDVCVLEAGRLRWQGSPSGLSDDNALRDLYLGVDAAPDRRDA